MTTGDRSRDDAAILFVTHLARALHAFGSPSHRLEAEMVEVSRSLGLEASFFATPTAVFASFGQGAEQHVRLERVEPGEHNLEKLAAADRVAARVADGRLGLEEATAEVDAILAAAPRYPAWLSVAAFAVASAGAARFFGGGLVDLGVSTVAGLLIGLLALLAPRVAGSVGVFEALAALTASLVASGAAVLLGTSGTVVTLAGLVVLFPGLTLTIAMAELASRHLASGTARLTGAVTMFLMIGLGVALGARAATLLPAATPLPAVPLPLWTEPVAVVAVCLALVVLFRAHPRDAGWVLLAGAIGFWGARLGARALGPELGTFAGGVLVGLVANGSARALRRPAAVASVPGIMLLVPGSVGFRSVLALIDDNVVSGIETATNAAMVAAALVTGLLVANVVLPSRRAL